MSLQVLVFWGCNVLDVTSQSVLAIAIIMALFAGAVLGHMLMPVYVYVTVTVTKEVTITKTVTIIKTPPYMSTSPPLSNVSVFNLQGYKVVVYANKVSLLILFKTNHDMRVTLIGPGNVTLSSILVKPTDDMAYLALAPPGVSPRPGEYKLIVTDLQGRRVYEKTFVFQGPKVKILNVTLKTGWDDVIKGFIDELNMTIANEGDMPAIISKVVVQVDAKNYTIPMKATIPIGEARLDMVHAIIAGLDKGNHRITIILLDDNNMVLATYTTTINIP